MVLPLASAPTRILMIKLYAQNLYNIIMVWFSAFGSYSKLQAWPFDFGLVVITLCLWTVQCYGDMTFSLLLNWTTLCPCTIQYHNSIKLPLRDHSKKFWYCLLSFMTVLRHDAMTICPWTIKHQHRTTLISLTWFVVGGHSAPGQTGWCYPLLQDHPLLWWHILLHWDPTVKIWHDLKTEPTIMMWLASALGLVLIPPWCL